MADRNPVSATPDVPTALPCHWGGGNDVIWCSTCGAEYAYAKGEPRPACPRADDTPLPAPRDTAPERRGDWMQTYTGRRFWPLDPRPEDVCIRDIAHALAQQTRFGGHAVRFYSVAEHSVHLARAASPEAALWLLLHDAAEAYVSDMIRPLKRFLPEFREAEDRVTWAIYQRFGLDPAHEPAEVKALDNRILIDERAQNMRPTGEAWHYGGATEPLGVTLQFWTPGTAEREFLHTFARLSGDWSVTTYRREEPETYAGMLTALADEIDSFAAHADADEEVPVVFTRQELHAISSSLRGDVAHVPATPAGETFATIAAWAEATFGPITPERTVARADEEMVELRAEPGSVEEAADVVICLARYANLWAAVERKMAVNRKRQWRRVGDGTGYHIKASPIAPFRAGDHVLHGPSGENWVVAWADPVAGDLAWCGWPDGIARISDCTLAKAATDAEHQQKLRELKASGGSRAAKVLRLYGEPAEA